MSRKLPVPYTSQWGEGASRYNNDCGAACLIMLMEFFGKRNGLTVDQVAAHTSLANGATGLMPAEIVTTGAHFGLPLTVRTATLDMIRAELDAGRPVCVLLAYRFITGRLDQGDNVPGKDGHYVNVVGYSGDPQMGIDHWLLDDPDYWVPYTERGHNFLCPVTDLSHALAAEGNQAIFVETTQMSSEDQIKALTASIRRELDQIDALAGTILPPPPPQSMKAIVANGGRGMNVRLAASLTAAILAELPDGTELMVTDSGIDSGGHRWMHVDSIANGQFPQAVGGFGAKDLLSFP